MLFMNVESRKRRGGFLRFWSIFIVLFRKYLDEREVFLSWDRRFFIVDIVLLFDDDE